MARLSAGLLTVLRCPVTGSTLVPDGNSLVSSLPDAAGHPVKYRVEEGIPVLLKADAPGAPGSVPAATA